MGMILVAVLIGLIPALIAKSKGYSKFAPSFFQWWLYGALLFIVALPHAVLMKGNKANLEAMQIADGMKKCPFCAEMIKAEAKVCRYCNRDQSVEAVSVV